MTGAAAVLAVDGGNSKTDLCLVSAEGRLLAAVRGPTISHQAVSLETGIGRLVTLTDRLAADAGLDARDRPLADIGAFCLAGADYRADVRALETAIAATGICRQLVIRNDVAAPLRAGAPRGWGVAVICGQGVNALGRAPDGRTARFAAVGEISGDWGGGTDVGMAGLGAAVRARDGRGPRTTLERLVPAPFGLATPAAVTRAIYDGRIDQARVGELGPIVFGAAAAEDSVAQGIVDHLAAELAVMAIALLRRLALVKRDTDVVLAGGVVRAAPPSFVEAVATRVRAVAPGARVARLTVPPVAGAAFLGFDEQAGDALPPARAEALGSAIAQALDGSS